MKLIIEKDKPLPTPRGKMRKLILKMQPGDSVVVDMDKQRKHFLSEAKRLGREATSRKEHGIGFRCWITKVNL